jgi:hypothetical protein
MMQGIQDGEKELERLVNEQMQPKNLRIDVKDDNDRWMPEREF